ncbi:LysR family transcriptional regulator [Roseibium sp. Sym1]|uniref:LysR family transcriptional regulator n=1 Tax=Roseibium sp. Sym1 TaxID=3016006 RepID=UPI0022B3C38F|nr:LysR family transcriptional regulator [Roseibium sp. Sym1]
MDDQVLRSFVAVCDRLNFREAGEDVARTQSAVSQQIKGLESELGVQLLQRSTRSVALTPAGETFYRHARKLLDLRQIAVSETRGTSERPRLRIGATDDVAAYGLVPALRSIEQDGEACSLDLETRPSEALLQEIGHRYDLVILVMPERSQAGTLVASLPLVWLGDAASAKENPLPLAVYADKCAMREAALAALDRAGIRWITKAKVSGLLVIEAAIRAGLAVAPALCSLHAPGLPRLTGLPALPPLELRIVAGSALGERYLESVTHRLRTTVESQA